MTTPNPDKPAGSDSRKKKPAPDEATQSFLGELKAQQEPTKSQPYYDFLTQSVIYK